MNIINSIKANKIQTLKIVDIEQESLKNFNSIFDDYYFKKGKLYNRGLVTSKETTSLPQEMIRFEVMGKYKSSARFHEHIYLDKNDKMVNIIFNLNKAK